MNVTLDDGVLGLQVRDTGSGIDEVTLVALQEQLQGRSRSEDSGFGLFYVNEQVKLSCGAAYGVVLDSVKGAWTTSTVYVPARLKESLDEKY